MKLDNPRAFDVLANDRIRLAGAKQIPCALLDYGQFSMGGSRIVSQPGEHLYVRVEKTLMLKPFSFGDTMTLEAKGAAIVKEVHTEGDFYVYIVTAHARRAQA
jgi:hypothetical protein